MAKLLNIDTNRQLLEIFSKFDMKLEKIEDYYYVNGEYPAIASQAFEMERFEEFVIVQLDIYLIFPNQHFIESFIGQAPSVEEALDDAFEQFEVNLLHTLIVAFWADAKHIENGVGTDIWEVNGARWQIVVSNYGYRGLAPIDEIITDIDMLFDTIEANIKALPLDKDIYAVRTVYTNVGDGRAVTEALINNKPFFELEKSVSNLPWKNFDTQYSVRNFLLAMKLK